MRLKLIVVDAAIRDEVEVVLRKAGVAGYEEAGNRRLRAYAWDVEEVA